MHSHIFNANAHNEFHNCILHNTNIYSYIPHDGLRNRREIMSGLIAVRNFGTAKASQIKKSARETNTFLISCALTDQNVQQRLS